MPGPIAASSVRPSAPPAARACGGCNVCCTAMRVPSLDKVAGQMCQHQCETGCGSYDDRPHECRDWYCMWVRDEGRTFADHHRPDRLGVFFTATRPDPISGVQTINAHEVWPGAAQTPEPMEVIAYLRRFAPVQLVPARPTPASLVTLTISAE